MIYFIEMQCEKWAHVQVNAGVIELVHKAFPQEECALFGEREHIREVKSILKDDYLITHNINLPTQIMDSIKNENDYRIILEYIISQGDADKVILLSAHKGIILSVYSLARKYKKKNFFIIVHSIMEQLYHKNTCIHKCYRWLLRREKNLDWVLEQIDEDNNNIKFIIYVPEYKDRMEKKVSSKVVEKFYFLHHPYIFSESHTNLNSNNHEVAVWGAALNKTARKIIKNCHEIKYNIVQRNNINLNDLYNVNIIKKGHNVSSYDIKKCIDQSSWVLIPYDKHQYQITASGLFWDAIANHKPLLTLDSPYFCSYIKKYEIGQIYYSVNSMVMTIEHLANEISKEEYERLVFNIKSFIDIVQVENEQYIVKILGE